MAVMKFLRIGKMARSVMPRVEQVTASPGLDEAMIKKLIGDDKGLEYAVNKIQKTFDKASELLKTKNVSVDDIGAGVGLSNFGKVNPASRARILRSKRDKEIMSKINEGATFSDNMMGHNVPQKALGLLGTAWVVNTLAGTKGQQTNAQLYGQAPGPGM